MGSQSTGVGGCTSHDEALRDDASFSRKSNAEIDREQIAKAKHAEKEAAHKANEISKKQIRKQSLLTTQQF